MTRAAELDRSPLVIEAISAPEAPYYVYLLVDSVTGRPFYVGKGHGERFRSHGIEAAVLSAADATGAEQRRKAARIQSIRASGHEPRIEFARIRIPNEREAFLVEAALIDVLDRHGDPLVNEVRDGLGLLRWQHEGFAYADSYDEESVRYRGLRGGQLVQISQNDLSGLLVRPEVAEAQLERERAAEKPEPPFVEPPTGGGGTDGGGAQPAVPPGPVAPTRYHGTVRLDPNRVGRDAGRIADEVISHLVGLVGADISVTLEIEARIPGGAPEQIVRVVTQNGRDLKFSSGGFEKD